ncbi:helix-turn-helix domain-containing protein [Actinokineospora sp. 24-640]
MYVDGVGIGRRVREIRAWRGLTLSAVAQVAGMSPGYLSMIERGLRPVTKRRVLESLAAALRVAPGELTGTPDLPADADAARARSGTALLADVLGGWRLDEYPDAPDRPWSLVLADVDRLNLRLRPGGDDAGQAELLPALIRDLLAAAGRAKTRRAALAALVTVYHAADSLSARLGVPGAAMLATDRVAQAADALGDPVWCAVASWSRVHLISGTNRARQYELATRAADTITAQRPETLGMVHLSAAFAAAVLGDTDRAEVHLREAADVADRITGEVSPWPAGLMHFGRANVGIWRVAIGVETGRHAWVHDTAATIHLDAMPASRRAAYWADYGRALLGERRRRGEGIAALMRAERIAPQQLRANPYARDAVVTALAAAIRDAGGRDLRGLAWRMGIAP